MNGETSKLEELVIEVRNNVQVKNIGDTPITFEFSKTLRNGGEFYKSDISFPKTIRFITDRT